MTVLITGGTGLVGSRLTEMLKAKGYQVRHLSRRRNLNAATPAYAWSYENGTIDADALTDVQHIIHLAGANVAGGLWTAAYKKEIMDSRVRTTELLEREIKARNLPIKSIIAASAMGIYGDVAQPTDENGATVDTFLGDVCVQWEKSVRKIEDLGVRACYLRIGLVMSTKGGALQKLLPTYAVGVGSYFGDGKMLTSWIHLDDLCKMFLTAMENDTWSGAYNAVAPKPLTSREMGKAVGMGLDKPNAILMPAPAFALKMAPGGMSVMFLNNANIVPKRALAAGFEFDFTDLAEAVRDLVKRDL